MFTNKVKSVVNFSIGIIFLLVSQVGFAATFNNVNSDTSLRAAIASLNGSPGTAPLASANTINITGSFSVSGSNLPVLLNGVTVNGGGFTINGNNLRLFATSKSDLYLSSLTLTGGRAIGTNGTTPGGGGGLGAGGGVYIDAGRSLTLSNTIISSNSAVGGNGGGAYTNLVAQSGAAGGSASFSTGVGEGSNAGYGAGKGGNGYFYPSSNALGGTANINGSGNGSNGANAPGNPTNDGGAGGGGGYFAGGGGGGGGDGGGGGGGGGGVTAGTFGTGATVGTSIGKNGGAGGIFGLGGSGGSSGSLGSRVGGGGGGGGGFGAGGGGGGSWGYNGGAGGGSGGAGGGGGFGAGGGASGDGTNSAGGSIGGGAGGRFGGGGSSNGDGGGGGGALGGGVFVGDGASLHIGDTSGSSPASNISSNSTTPGTAGTGGGNGSTASSSDLFLLKGASLVFDGSNSLTAGFKIDCDTSATGSNIDAGVTVSTTLNAIITLSTANTYQGGTTVNSGGVLALGDNSSLGTGALVMSGGSLQASATLTNVTNNYSLSAPSTMNGSNSFTMSGTGNLSSNLLTVANTAGTITLSGVMSGTGDITRNGTGGTLALSAVNTYSGTTTVTAGTLALGNNAAMGSGALVMSGGSLQASATLTNVTNNYTLNANSTINGTNNLTMSGTGNLSSNLLTVANTAGTITLSGIISGTGGMTRSGTGGTLVLSAANTYTGTTTISDGTLALGDNAAMGSGALVLGGGFLQATTTLNNIANNFSLSAPSSMNGTNSFTMSGTGNLSANLLTVANTFGTISLSGIISGTGDITLNGTGGVLALSAVNTYSGTTTVTAGTLSLGNNAAMGAGALSMNGGALQSSTTLTGVTNNYTLNAASTINGTNNLTMSGTGNLNSNLLTVANTAGTITLSGIISGAGGITRNSAGGTLVLSAANTYTGTTTISAGTLQAGVSNAIPSSSPVTLANTVGAIFDLNDFDQSIGVLSGGGVTGGNIDLGAATLTVNQGSNTTYAGVISGSGSLSKAGGSILTLSNANTYSGTTTVTAGTLALGNNAAMGTGALSMNGGSLQASATLTGVTNNYSLSAPSTMNGTNNFTISGTGNLNSSLLTVANTAGTITLSGVISGTGGITRSGAGGTLVLSAENTYAGTTTISAGTLQAGVSNAIPSSSPVTLANTSGAIFDLNDFDQSIGVLSGGGTTGGNITLGSATLTVNQTADEVFAGNISETGNLTLSGSSTNSLTLSGTNTYTGTTTVTGGTLIFNGGSTASNIVNNSIMTIAATLTSTNNISTSNRLNLNADITMSGGTTLINTGAVYVSGNRSLGAGDYISSGNTQYFTITDASVYDSITTTGVINVDGDTINVSSSYIGEINIPDQWPILNGGSISHIGTTVNLPTLSLFNDWSSSFTSTQLLVSHVRSNFVVLANPGINTILAQVLDDMSANTTNSGQQSLIDAFGSYSNSEDYNYGLQQLVPNINPIAPNISVMNSTYNLIGSRIIAAQQDIEDPELSGIAAGSICPNATFWLAGFGSVANQQTTSDTLGYRASALGTMLGLDLIADNDDIYGFGFAFSNTEVRESLNTTSETRVYGYHALLYGSNYFYGNNFLEWMFTGVKNQNKGGRQIFINGSDFSTNAYFNSWMGGARFNIGKNIDFSNWRLAQVNTMQYSYLYQSAYNEAYSPAALRVAKIEDNVLTIGSGARVIWHPDPSSWLQTTPAIHAMLTYDVISSAQAVNSSFIVGSDNFTIIQSPARIAARFGLDLTAEICDRLQLQISYDLELRSKYIDNTGELKLLYLF